MMSDPDVLGRKDQGMTADANVVAALSQIKACQLDRGEKVVIHFKASRTPRSALLIERTSSTVISSYIGSEMTMFATSSVTGSSKNFAACRKYGCSAKCGLK
jgi:hypothetical protein